MEVVGWYRPESDWTRPRPECPHPQRWHADSGRATEVEVIELIAALVRALQPELVVETGVFYGAATRAIGEALARNGHGHLHGLEMHSPYAAEAARALTHLPVTVHHMSSLDWTPPGPIDLAWLDSRLDARWQEIERYWPALHDRTVLAIHDTGPQHPVRDSLRRFADKLVLLDLPTPRGVTLARLR